MKTFKPGLAKRLAVSLIGLGALGGCAVVPYGTGYYDQPEYAAPVYAAPVYVAPAVNFGFGFGGGYYGHRGYGHGHYGGHGYGRR